jgi:hypothetical protein
MKCPLIEYCELFVFNNNMQIQKYSISTLVNLVRQPVHANDQQWFTTLHSRLLSTVAILIKMNFVEDTEVCYIQFAP